MISKKSRFAILEHQYDLLEQLEAEAAVGWSNVSPPLTQEQLFLQQLVQTIHNTLEEGENARQ